MGGKLFIALTRDNFYEVHLVREQSAQTQLCWLDTFTIVSACEDRKVIRCTGVSKKDDAGANREKEGRGALRNGRGLMMRV